MTIVSIMDLEPGEQFQFFISKSMGLEKTISEIIRYDDDGTTPIARRIATYWTDRQEWVPVTRPNADEEKWNSSSEVVRVKFNGKEVEYL